MYLINFMLKCHYTLLKLKGQLTPKEKLVSFLKELYPVDTNIPLKRVGQSGDGGYLVPDDFEGIEACLSPGTGYIIDFEKECADMGMKVLMADATVDLDVTDMPGLNFIKKYISDTTHGEYISIPDWIEDNDVSEDGDLLLQIDIEGAEYQVMPSLDENLIKRFRIIVIELHRLDRLWSRKYYDLITGTIRKLLLHHYCVHNHPNNQGGLVHFGGISIPRSTELTFIRKDRVTNKSFSTQFPHPLDEDNIAFPHISLPQAWYSSKP